MKIFENMLISADISIKKYLEMFPKIELHIVLTWQPFLRFRGFPIFCFFFKENSIFNLRRFGNNFRTFEKEKKCQFSTILSSTHSNNQDDFPLNVTQIRKYF